MVISPWTKVAANWTGPRLVLDLTEARGVTSAAPAEAGAWADREVAALRAQQLAWWDAFWARSYIRVPSRVSMSPSACIGTGLPLPCAASAPA